MGTGYTTYVEVRDFCSLVSAYQNMNQMHIFTQLCHWSTPPWFLISDVTAEDNSLQYTVVMLTNFGQKQSPSTYFLFSRNFLVLLSLCHGPTNPEIPLRSTCLLGDSRQYVSLLLSHFIKCGLLECLHEPLTCVHLLQSVKRIPLVFVAWLFCSSVACLLQHSTPVLLSFHSLS